MPDIYIVLGTFILFMALLTYIVPAGQYDRQVVETAHGVQNLVVAGTYKPVPQHPAGWLDVVSAIPYGFERAAGVIVLTFLVGACMGLIKRAGLIDLGVQKLSKAVGTSEFLVAPVLMLVLSLLAAFIGVPELSLAYLPVFLPLFYRLGYDGMTATAVALLSPCMGFTFGITIPGSVGMGQQIAQVTMFSGSGLRAVVLAIVIAVSILYVMIYAARVKKDPKKSLTYDTDIEMKAKLAEEGAGAVEEMNFTQRQVYAGISCLILFPIAIYLHPLDEPRIRGDRRSLPRDRHHRRHRGGQVRAADLQRHQRRHARPDGGRALVRRRLGYRRRDGQGRDHGYDRLLARKHDGHHPARFLRDWHVLGTGDLQRPDPGGHGPHHSDDADSLAARLPPRRLPAGDRERQRLGWPAHRHFLPDLRLLHRDARDCQGRIHEVAALLYSAHAYSWGDRLRRTLPAAGFRPQFLRKTKMFDTLIKNGRVVLADREETLDIGIRDGRIAALAPNIDTACAREMVDASGQYVMPGMVDAHMHVSEPGRTEWEGYETGTQAMVAGGITSFVEMPLNTIPATTNVETLELKLRTAEGKCWADYAPMGGLVPWNLDDLAPLADAGVAAFKAFVATCGSGKPGDFKNVTDFELYEGCRRIAQKDGLLVVHCENATITDGLGKAARAAGLTKLSDYVASRPIFTEVEAVHRVLLIAEAAGCRIHIAHCTCAEVVEEIKRAQVRGVDASFESCPHYFLLCTEELDAVGPKAKCSPPIRDRRHQEILWKMLANDEIEMLVSDHSPCTIDLKSSDNAFDAWGGISGCQNCVDAMFDEAVLKRHVSPVVLARALSTRAARRFRLEGKGEIALGMDADLVLIDPTQSYTVTADKLYYKNKFSAFEGRRIDCRITRTMVRGTTVYTLEEGIVGEPVGHRIPLS